MTISARLRSLALAICIVQAGAWPAVAMSSPTSPPPSNPVDSTVTEFLLASAARDFGTMPGKAPASVRGVRVGYLDQQGTRTYLMCGSFQSTASKQGEWVPFATLKTSDYEQWLGGSATPFCKHEGAKWQDTDLSTELLRRLRDARAP